MWRLYQACTSILLGIRLHLLLDQVIRMVMVMVIMAVMITMMMKMNRDVCYATYPVQMLGSARSKSRTWLSEKLSSSSPS